MQSQQLRCARPLNVIDISLKISKYGHLLTLFSLCKHHFSKNVKISLQKELKNLYRHPEKAYSAMDFSGKGYITEQDFYNCIVMQRVQASKGYTQADVKEFFIQNNLFSSGLGLTMDHFKTLFFPQLFLIDQSEESEDEKQAKVSKLILQSKEQTTTQQEALIAERLKKLEKLLKMKFSNNWESVRKAFLALDSDHDGFITVEDILRHFGQEKGLNDYNDLKKIIMDKDSSKRGKIGYTDFSKWVGNTIHMSEGFYFRHDSVRNPQFDEIIARNEKNNKDKTKEMAEKPLINDSIKPGTLEKIVLEKIKFQWKTLRKAFMDLNVEKSGAIEKEELKFYLHHWGLNGITDEQFQVLFNKFDADGDGKISYKDFQITVGSEIHPAEGLYFRQDHRGDAGGKKEKNSPGKPEKQRNCQHAQCWQPVLGNNNYCQLHLKVEQDESLKIFEKIFFKVGIKWDQLIDQMKKQSDPEDQTFILLEDFEKILEKFNYKLKLADKNRLLQAFPGRDDKRLNIGKLYDQKYNLMLRKLYTKLNVHENDGEDDPIDQSGYLGQFYRPNQKPLKQISECDLVRIIHKDNKLKDILRTIYEIDKQHNGYVTTTELDDILKLNYKTELGNKDLRLIMRKYASIQNRILVDYKKFRDSLLSQLKEIDQIQAEDDSRKQQFNNRIRLLCDKKISGKLNETLHNFLQTRTQQMEKGNHQTPRRNEPSKTEMENCYKDESILNTQRPNKSQVSERKLSLAAQKQEMNKTFTSLKKNSIQPSKSNERIISSIFKRRTGDNSGIDIKRVSDRVDELLQLKQTPERLNNSITNINAYNTTNDTKNNNSLLDLITPKKDDSMLAEITEKIKRAQSSHGLSRQKLRLKGIQTLNMSQQKRRNIGSINDQEFNQESQKAYDCYNTLEINTNRMKYSSGSQLYSTVSQISQQDKFKHYLQSKLQYCWKKVYRILSLQDTAGNGLVSLKGFEKVIHQLGIYLSKDDLFKLSKLYGSPQNLGQINYQSISMDLGMHFHSFQFLKNQHSRQQNIIKLRNIYTSNNEQRSNMVFNTVNLVNGATPDTNKEASKIESTDKEVSEILKAKNKEFQDLVSLFSRKYSTQNGKIVPLMDFKTILKTLGIFIQTSNLKRFLSKQHLEGTQESPSVFGKRAKSSHGYMSINGGDSSWIRSLGIDTEEFFKFYNST